MADQGCVETMNSNTPYEIYENDYWHRPRHVCVVDEIHPIGKTGVVIICSREAKNDYWIRILADHYFFTVEREEGADEMGPFAKYTITVKE